MPGASRGRRPWAQGGLRPLSASGVRASVRGFEVCLAVRATGTFPASVVCRSDSFHPTASGCGFTARGCLQGPVVPQGLLAVIRPVMSSSNQLAHVPVWPCGGNRSSVIRSSGARCCCGATMVSAAVGVTTPPVRLLAWGYRPPGPSESVPGLVPVPVADITWSSHGPVPCFLSWGLGQGLISSLKPARRVVLPGTSSQNLRHSWKVSGWAPMGTTTWL